jgi:hypothetical protein
MESLKNHFFVQVSVADGSAYDVGPFEASGGAFRMADSAIDWVYKQIGLLKSKYPDAILIKHRWNYKAEGRGPFGDEAIVDIRVEIAGFTFEIVPLRTPKYTNVIEELIEPRLADGQP